MPNQTNIDQVAKVAKNIEAAKSAALIQYQGLNAQDISALRDSVKKSGGVIEVVKNSLLTLSLKNLGIDLPETLTGPTAIASCQDDEIAPLKEIEKVNKEKDVTSFKYGIFNQKLLSLEDLMKFLSLPSRSALLAQFIGGLSNPLQRLAYALKFNQHQLVLTLKALEEKKAAAN